MKQYTIYCSDEQTKKAYELGAPIEYHCPNEREKVYHNPTAEQMHGWLEEQLGITTFHIMYYPAFSRYGYLIIAEEVCLECHASERGKHLFITRAEATLAAIDAALDYLIKNKRRLMEKKRVPYGEKFWFIRTDGRINYRIEYEDLYSKGFFDCDNYFHSKEEAEATARKIRAVLKGADVIEMPSEEEIESAIPTYTDRPAEFSAGVGNGWWQCYNLFKTKIIK